MAGSHEVRGSNPLYSTNISGRLVRRPFSFSLRLPVARHLHPCFGHGAYRSTLGPKPGEFDAPQKSSLTAPAMIVSTIRPLRFLPVLIIGAEWGFEPREGEGRQANVPVARSRPRRRNQVNELHDASFGLRNRSPHGIPASDVQGEARTGTPVRLWYPLLASFAAPRLVC